MNNIFLEDLFDSLNSENIDYLVLRGYQHLPQKYSHDIDFSVIDEPELQSFFNVLHNLSKKYDYSISRDVVRVGLIKVFLHFGEGILKIDVFCAFEYAGLEYFNSIDLHESKRKLPSGIYVPLLNYELAISLLKEILHNSRIRKDKVDLLRSQYDKKTFKHPLEKYFSNNNIKQLSASLFSHEKLVFKKVSRNFRFVLILKNLKYNGINKTFKKILSFFVVKYLCQHKYDYVILNNNLRG